MSVFKDFLKIISLFTLVFILAHYLAIYLRPNIEISREPQSVTSQLVKKPTGNYLGKNKVIKANKILKTIKRTKKQISAKYRKKLKQKTVKTTHPFAQVAEFMGYAERCEKKFIGEEGFGIFGKFIKKELSLKYNRELLKNSKILAQVCPRYKLLNREAKKNLWVFILMAMSHYESSCRSQAEAQGPNGIAKGLLQLHEGSENKYVHWDNNRICQKGDSNNQKESIQCTLSMLNGQVHRFNSIFYDYSYWDVLRNSEEPGTHASKIRKAIKMLPDCGALQAIAAK